VVGQMSIFSHFPRYMYGPTLHMFGTTLHVRYNPTYDRMYGNFPVKNAMYTPCMSVHIWFWPALVVDGVHVRFWPALVTCTYVNAYNCCRRDREKQKRHGTLVKVEQGTEWKSSVIKVEWVEWWSAIKVTWVQ